RPSAGVRRGWHRVPDRRPAVLDDLEPVDHGPAVLRDPQQSGAQHGSREGQVQARRREGRPQRTECDSRGRDDRGRRGDRGAPPGAAAATKEADAPAAQEPGAPEQVAEPAAGRRHERGRPAVSENLEVTEAETPADENTEHPTDEALTNEN